MVLGLKACERLGGNETDQRCQADAGPRRENRITRKRGRIGGNQEGNRGQ